MTAPRIVDCTGAHVSVLSALHALCFADPWSEKAMADLLAMPGAFGLISLDGEDPTGFILCRGAAGEGEVITLGVVPTARGRGIGAGLIVAAAGRARTAGLRRLFLEVAEDNKAARALYGGAGFSEVGRRGAYYARPDGPAVDALILALDL